MKKSKSSRITSYVIVFISMVMVVYSFVQQILITNKEKTLSQQVHEEVKKTLDESFNQPSEQPDYNSLSTLHKLILKDNFESWTPQSNTEPSKMMQTVVVDRGSLAKGYVYIKASVDNKALTLWESIYMTMNYRGGHLFRPQSLPVPKRDKTELLYSLNDIPFLNNIPYNEQVAPGRTNWFNLFTNNNRIQVVAFISSLRPAKFEELALYYSCEFNSDCFLSKLNE